MNFPKTARRVLWLELILGATASLGCGLWGGWPWLWASFLGFLLVFLPNLLFALMVFRVRGATKAKKITYSLYKAEAVKWFITVALFALSLWQHDGPKVPLFVTFIVVQLAYWLVLVLE